MIVSTGESDAAVMLQEQIDAMSPEEWAAMNKRVAARIVASAKRLNRPVPPDMLKIDETPVEDLIERRRSAIAQRDAVPSGSSGPSNSERSTSFKVRKQGDFRLDPRDVPPMLPMPISMILRSMDLVGETTGVVGEKAQPNALVVQALRDAVVQQVLQSRGLYEYGVDIIPLLYHTKVPGVSADVLNQVVTDYLSRAEPSSGD